MALIRSEKVLFLFKEEKNHFLERTKGTCLKFKKRHLSQVKGALIRFELLKHGLVLRQGKK